MCNARSVAVTPSRNLPGHVHAHHFRREEINRLTEHAGFRLDPAHAPADDAEPVDHRRVRIRPDQRVRVEKLSRSRLSAERKNPFREIFEIHLVHDPDAGRHEPESLERLLAPFQELVTLAVALELHFHVQPQRLRRTGEIDLHGVVDHQIDRHERLDDFRIAAELLHGAAHRRQIDHQRNAGEVLENDAGDDERDFFVGRRLRVPIRQRLDVLSPDLFAIAIAQDRFEDDANADRQPGDLADALLFERGQGMERAFAAVAGVEVRERLEFVSHFNSASFALILSKLGSSRASSLLSAY